MKVLLTTDAVGGVWTHSLDLARGLAQQGVQVTLAVMGPAPAPDMQREAERVPGLKLEARPYRLEWMDEAWDDVQAAGEWLQGLERSHQVDLVHSNSYAHGAHAFDAPVVLGAHSCIHGWWEAVHGEDPPGEKWRTYQEKVHEGIQGADLVVAPTAWMLRSLKRHYGPVSTPMRTIRNGRSPFSGPDHKEDLALWVGRVWDEAKNALLFDQAAGRGVPWRTRVIGDDRHPDRDTRVRLEHVEQCGRVPAKQLREAYARAGVFVSTARYEPFGLGPLEAAQAGCALLLPRIGSLQETWEDDALFYKPDDPEELQHLLHELALDPDLHIRHCERARQRAQDLTHHKMAADYHDAYTRLLDRGDSSHTASRNQATDPHQAPLLHDTGLSGDPSPTVVPRPGPSSSPASAQRPTRRPLDDPERPGSPRSFPANPFRSSPTMLPSDAALPAARTRPTGPYRTDISRPAYAPEPRSPGPTPTKTRTKEHAVEMRPIHSREPHPPTGPQAATPRNLTRPQAAAARNLTRPQDVTARNLTRPQVATARNLTRPQDATATPTNPPAATADTKSSPSRGVKRDPEVEASAS